MNKRIAFRIIALIVLSSAFQSCGTAPVPDAASLPEKNAAELFSYSRVPEFRIAMPAEQWTLLKKNCRDEKYVPADAWFEGARIGRVGIRFKGNVGSLGNCFNKDGEFICRKLSMKMKFDEYDGKNRFFGLKRLNFHAYRWDPTNMKEPLAYELFRSMGVVAPRSSWAQLTVNGERLGLFGMVEEIDGRFTADRWPEYPDGNLYKESWPGTTDKQWILSKLETNKDAADIGAFLAFSQAMAAAKPEAVRKALGASVDLDYMARYMAVDDGIANFDGITAYYASLKHEWEGAGNHNYFFYQSAADKFTLIPWDVASTFDLGGGFITVPRWTDGAGDGGKLHPVWAGDIAAVAPGRDPVFRALAADLKPWRAACREFLDGPFREQAVTDAVDRHAAFIRAAVKADPNGPAIEEFEGAVGHLKKQIRLLRLRLESLISDKPAAPVEINSGKILDFEGQGTEDLAMGTPLVSNANSVVAVEIDSSSPLAGKHDLLYSFRFVDEQKGNGQWTILNIPLARDNHDLTALSGVRFLVRANGARLLRLDLDGPGNPDPLAGIRYGWDLNVAENPMQVEVRFADASPPSWAKAKGNAPRDLLANATAFIFSPQCRGRNWSGQLGKGNIDAGFIRIDNIELF